MELPELKKRVSERKNSLDGIESKFDIVEERSQSLNTQPQTLSKLKPTHIKQHKQSLRDLWDNMKQSNIGVGENQMREDILSLVRQKLEELITKRPALEEMVKIALEAGEK